MPKYWRNSSPRWFRCARGDRCPISIEKERLMVAWYYVLIALTFGVCLGLLVGGLARSAGASDAALGRVLTGDAKVADPESVTG
jgi:hypothetical protein